MNDLSKLKESLTYLAGAVNELGAISTYVNQIITLQEQKESHCEGDKPSLPSEDESSMYAEIIGDELNHLERFLSAFLDASGFFAKEE